MKYYWLFFCLLSPTIIMAQASDSISPPLSKLKQLSGTWILETLAIEPYDHCDLGLIVNEGLFWDDASGLFVFSYSDSSYQKKSIQFQLTHKSDQQDKLYDGLLSSSKDSLYIKLNSDIYSVDIVNDSSMSLKKRIPEHSTTLQIFTFKKIPFYSDLSPSNKLKMDHILSQLDGTWSYKEARYAANPHCMSFSCPTCIFNQKDITSNIFHFDSQKKVITTKDQSLEYPFLLYFYYDYIYIRILNQTYSIQQVEDKQLQFWLDNKMSCPYYFVLERL